MEVSLPKHYFCFVGHLGFQEGPFGIDYSSVSAICAKGSRFATICGFSREKKAYKL
jgi:hypothetical protein